MNIPLSLPDKEMTEAQLNFGVIQQSECTLTSLACWVCCKKATPSCARREREHLTALPGRGSLPQDVGTRLMPQAGPGGRAQLSPARVAGAWQSRVLGGLTVGGNLIQEGRRVGKCTALLTGDQTGAFHMHRPCTGENRSGVRPQGHDHSEVARECKLCVDLIF